MASLIHRHLLPALKRLSRAYAACRTRAVLGFLRSQLFTHSSKVVVPLLKSTRSIVKEIDAAMNPSFLRPLVSLTKSGCEIEWLIANSQKRYLCSEPTPSLLPSKGITKFIFLSRNIKLKFLMWYNSIATCLKEYSSSTNQCKNVAFRALPLKVFHCIFATNFKIKTKGRSMCRSEHAYWQLSRSGSHLKTKAYQTA